MTTPPPSRGRDGPAAEAPEDELTFAVHDLGRERVATPAAADEDLGFVTSRTGAPVSVPVAPAPLPVAPSPPAAPVRPADGFVISELLNAAPTVPLDALVVGAPEPAVEEDEEDGEAPGEAPTSFRISTTSAARVPTPEQLWTTRTPAAEPAADSAQATSRRGWSTRHSDVVEHSAHATMLRLREEAVNVSWKAAWVAVTQCDPRLQRKRGARPS